MTRARWTLVWLAVLPIAACRSGTTSAKGTSTSAPTAPAASTAATPSTAAAAAGTCRATTAGTSGNGGTDVLVPGDIPDGVHYVNFNSPGFHLDHPEGWAQQASGTTVTFTDKFNSIRVETAAVPAAPSVASAQANDVAALTASVPCFQAGKVTAVSRRGGPAVLITYRADSPADPVTGKVIRLDVERYEFWQSGTQATIILSSPQGSDNVDPWRKVTDSFGWGA